MTVGRWLEIESDIESSAQHFQLGAQLGESSEPQVSISGVPSAYLQKMAFMHAMQAGYTSLESAFSRILRLFNEERPLGDTGHLDLMNRLARPAGDRPVFISRDLLPAVDEARRFRHQNLRLGTVALRRRGNAGSRDCATHDC